MGNGPLEVRGLAATAHARLTYAGQTGRIGQLPSFIKYVEGSNVVHACLQ